MAKPKAKKPSGSAPRAPASTRSVGQKNTDGGRAAKVAYDPNKDRRALDSLIAKHGEPDAIEVEAFAELIDDAGRAKLGNQTKAVGVLRDGVAWAVEISAAFTDCAAALAEQYTADRFRYLLHCLRRLGEAIRMQEEERGGQGSTQTTTAEREGVARDARADLLAKLTSYSGAREPERAALAEAIGTTEDFNALGSSIEGLAKLSRLWLAREDKKSRIVARSTGLNEAIVDRALTAAEALAGAATTATLAGRRAGTDSPTVNIAEGSVLFEMMEAKTCFERAHGKSPVVPRLTPGAATRHVLGSKTAAKKDADPEGGAPVAPSVG